jgi:hypothetical protein
MTQVSSAFVADPELTKELERLSKPIALGLDRVLFHQGDAPTGVYILSKGAATLTRRFVEKFRVFPRGRRPGQVEGARCHRSANTVTSSAVAWSAVASPIRTSQAPACPGAEQETSTGGSREAPRWE